jgi:hypothetical protein
MSTTTKTSVRKRTPVHFLVDGLQVWVSYIDATENHPFGVLFKWMEGKGDSSPLQHITDDGGYSFQCVESFAMEEGVEKRCGKIETDPERLSRLQKIWVKYQQILGETVFSV